MSCSGGGRVASCSGGGGVASCCSCCRWRRGGALRRSRRSVRDSWVVAGGASRRGGALQWCVTVGRRGGALRWCVASEISSDLWVVAAHHIRLEFGGVKLG